MIAPLVTVAHAAENGSGGMPQFDVAHFPSQILWLTASVLVLYFLLSRVALPRVSEIVTTREQAITGEIERADELHRKAEELRSTIAEEAAKLQADIQQVGAESKDALSRQLEEEKRQATARLAERTKAGEQRVQALRLARKGSAAGSDAAAQLERISAEVTTALVEKLRGRGADPALVRQMIRALVEAG